LVLESRHRYPFLLIDRVIDIRGEDHGIGIKNVTMNEAHFAPTKLIPTTDVGWLLIPLRAREAAYGPSFRRDNFCNCRIERGGPQHRKP
jgi:hypothetical protein